MGLLEQASLVITPTAVKAGKLYSVIPNNGTGDLDVVRATSATRVNSAGLIETVGNNIARLDYTNGSCPSILVEPQRTNLLVNSNGNLSTYLSSDGNVSDALIPILGFTNSIQIGDNSVTSYAYKRTFTPTVGVQYVLSVFVQMDDNSLPLLGLTSTTGDFSLIIAGGRGNVNPEVNRIGNTNIYRVSVAFTATSTINNFGVIKYTEQSSKGFRFAGIQLEEGSNATSYIPTVASSVTRGADTLSKTSIGSLIGTTEGVVYFDFSMRTNMGSNVTVFRLTGGSEVIVIFGEANGNLGISSSTTGLRYIQLSTAFDNRYKVAYAYKANDYALFVNGVQISLNSVSSVFSTLNNLYINQTPSGAEIGRVVANQLLLFKTRLTNAQLAQLTTL